MAKTIGKWRDFGFDEGGMGQLNAALKQALPTSKARKAVSALLNQENARLLGYPQNKHRLSRRRSRRLSAPVASCRCRD